MRTFITSDHHFGHRNIILYASRPFNSVGQMNETMIKKWNDKVTNDDLVYHLGDLGLTNKKYFQYLGLKLKGRMIIISGNHDKVRYLRDLGFAVRERGETITIKNLILSHEPLKPVPDGFVNVHGHIHNRRAYGRRINACVDVTKFEPINIAKYFGMARGMLI